MSETGTQDPVLHFPRDLEPFDYLMFRGESDPRSRTAALNGSMLDTVPDFERLCTAFERASRVVVRLRQHVVVPTLPLSSAQWITDPDFDLGFHVRHVRLPEPGSMRQLLDFAAKFLARPLDLARPLWEVLLVDGVTEGDAPAALLMKMHHAITDGVGSFELFKQLYDFERDVDRGPLPSIPVPEDVSPNDLTRNALMWLPLTVIRDTTRRTSRAIRVARRFVDRPATALRDMNKMMSSAQRVLGPSPVRSSPLLRRRGLGRRFELLEVPFAELRQAGKTVGGSLNDAFIAALCGGLRMYHEELGVPVDALPLAMPVSLRSNDDPAGGNRFAGARIVAPVGERDPAKRIANIRQQVLSAVGEPAINILTAIAPIVSRMPAPLLAAMSTSAGGIDVQASNVPGYPEHPFIAGARLTKLLPFGPLPGVPMMIMLVTQGGVCYVGVHYDTASITHHDLFAKSLRAGFDEVLALQSNVIRPLRPVRAR